MTLYLVIPCYNEESVLPLTSRAVGDTLQSLTDQGLICSDSRVLLVDDGSRDRTWEIIEELHRQDVRFEGVRLSRNRGHQNALLAGLSIAAERCDCAISMDADLQDDVGAIAEMLQRHAEGYDVVYGVRGSRPCDSPFKKTTALCFYRLMSAMGVELVYNHADFRLMSRRAIQGLLSFREVNLFLRGMVPLVGYPSTQVIYDRRERAAGTSKYPLSKMVAFALEGITSLSVKPIRLILALGLALLLLSSATLILLACLSLACRAIPLSAYLLVCLFLVCGLQLLALGTVGEYVGKIYLETKQRPRFIIDQLLLHDTQNESNRKENE